METSPAIDSNPLRSTLAAKDLEIQKLHARIEDLVRHDTLTGALNRRTLIEMLQTELQRSHRTGHPFCFVVMNLDHFHKVNAEYGHAVGDQVLRAIADVSLKLLRVLDRFGRYGSEEFAIVLPATWLDEGMLAMARLTNAITQHDWNAIAPGLAISFSAGITTNAVGDTTETIAMRAEKAMQQAKSEGRNKTVPAEEPLPPGLPPD